jgi:hypothetical protein
MDIRALTIGDANRALNNLLAQLGGQGSFEVQQKVAKEFNDLLYQAIVHSAAEVNAVQVVVTPELSRSDKAFPGRNTYFSGRHQLQKFLKMMNKEGEEFTFTKHLPFDYDTTEVDAKGDIMRSARRLVNAHPKFERDGTPYLSVDLSVHDEYQAQLFLDEVKEVRFSLVPETEFTPVWADTEMRSIAAPVSSIVHYVRFRGFNEYRSQNLHERLAAAGEVWVPRWNTELYTLDKEKYDGFALRDAKTNPALYEFRGLLAPKFIEPGLHNWHNVAAHGMLLNDHGEREDSIYKDRKIIERLSRRAVVR